MPSRRLAHGKLWDRFPALSQVDARIREAAGPRHRGPPGLVILPTQGPEAAQDAAQVLWPGYVYIDATL